jgi:pimeloyl-ACP methyl ester carboxylesterase
MLYQTLGLVFGLAAAVTSGQAPDDAWLLGEWLGELRLGDEVTLLKLQCKCQDGIQLTVNLPPFTQTGLAVRKLHIGRADISFELPLDGATLVFEGKSERSALTGKVQRGPAAGTFRMIRLARVEEKRLSACYGAYRISPSRFVWVAPFGEFGGGMYSLDSGSGRFSPLYPESDTTFFPGNTVAASLFPVDLRLTFHRETNEIVSGLTYRQLKSEELRAAKVPLRTEKVSFRNGAITLEGALTVPQEGGPHPAVVLVHGSGPEDRDFLGPWVQFFACQGVAVLAYDKRGVGASAGDWKRATISDLAGDAAAGLALLRGRADVDARRVGLFGISQGGWVAPLAARLSPSVAFVILHAGPAVTVAQQGLQYLEHELRGYGFPESDIAEALALQKLDDAFTRSGKGWEKLQEAHQKAVSRKAEWVQPLKPKDDWFRTMYLGMMDHDPVPDLTQLTCPVLGFFGELDHNVPPEPNKTLLQNALAKAGNRDHTVVVLPKANHLFLQATTGVRTEYPRLKGFVPTYFDTMAGWLRRVVNAR